MKRNRQRFPDDFVFQLRKEELMNLRFQIGTSRSGPGGSRYLPYAYTEHGAIMAANILNNHKAIRMSVFVVRAFVKMREQLATTHITEKRLAEIEKILLSHDVALADIYQKIRPLLLPPPESHKKQIGFRAREKENR
jgi:phage regulator Rha-like protein